MFKTKEKIPEKTDQSNQSNIVLFGPPANLDQMILSLYEPITTSWDDDMDLITSMELIESMFPICNVAPNDLFDKMNELGFMSRSIEGTLCWFIKYTK